MYSLSCHFILLVLLTNKLLYAQSSDDSKLEKTVKSSELKHRLAKGESLRGTDVLSSIRFEDGFEREPISVLGITIPPEFQNNTIEEDTHTYYNSTFYATPELGKQFWIDLDSSTSNASVHKMLSNSHRQATTIELSFEFPFYGHPLRNITIATGGFLYMGDYLHNWIAATQYIAPLMANFDTSQSAQSLIKYFDNGTAFTVQWGNISIQEQLNDGSFTFQTTLHKNGDIVFAYKDIPYPVANISDTRHPVKIGISDAYILERALFFVRRKTIYEYHRIDMLKRNISNNTALYFTALPTCNRYKDCTSCLAADVLMECGWCEAVKRCSDGIDRLRQSWIANACPINRETVCSAVTVSTSTDHIVSTSNKLPEIPSPGKNSEVPTKPTSKYMSSSEYNLNSSPSAGGIANNDIKEHAPFVQEESGSSSGVSIGAIITIVAFIVALIAAGTWIGYAYKFPQTPSGQFLIKYRPSQWALKPKDDNSIVTNSRHL